MLVSLLIIDNRSGIHFEFVSLFCEVGKEVKSEGRGGVDVEGRDRSRVERTVERADEYRILEVEVQIDVEMKIGIRKLSWRSTWKVEIETEIEMESDMNIEYQRSRCSSIEREKQI
jgi:hypothetical protein